jgi:hypothetical protein
MNVKQTTIEKYRVQVIKLISEYEYKKALELASKFPFSRGNRGGFIICKTRLMEEYNIEENQLINLNVIEKKNPHYSTASPMKLYLEDEVRLKFSIKVKSK